MSQSRGYVHRPSVDTSASLSSMTLEEIIQITALFDLMKKACLEEL